LSGREHRRRVFLGLAFWLGWVRLPLCALRMDACQRIDGLPANRAEGPGRDWFGRRVIIRCRIHEELLLLSRVLAGTRQVSPNVPQKLIGLVQNWARHRCAKQPAGRSANGPRPRFEPGRDLSIQTRWAINSADRRHRPRIRRHRHRRHIRRGRSGQHAAWLR